MGSGSGSKRVPKQAAKNRPRNEAEISPKRIPKGPHNSYVGPEAAHTGLEKWIFESSFLCTCIWTYIACPKLAKNFALGC